MPVSETILDHVYTTLRGMSAAEAAPKIRELAEYYGVVTASINRWARQKGLRFRTEKKTKAKSAVTRDMCMDAATLLLASRRKSNAIPLPTCDAKLMLEDSGRDTGGVSTSRFLARMREEGISAKHLLQPAPFQRLLSDHPNHVWQFDVTNCLQYFLDKNKGMGERDTEMTMYPNKVVATAKGIKKQLLRYVVVDHCAGAFFFQYFYASGEKARDGSDFLFRAMRPKDELIQSIWKDAENKTGKYRFHGVPLIMVADRGSIMAAKANQALFDALRIDMKLHMPGNPRAKGAVEGMMHHINRFEGRLKFQRPADLKELNLWALDWCIWANAVPKMRDVAPRSVLWSYITAEQLRLCPDYDRLRLLVKEPTIKRMADGARMISVDGLPYQVPDSQVANQWVNVVRHPYEAPAVEVHFNGFVWLCQPVPDDQYGRSTNGVKYGTYKLPQHTETQKAKTELEKKAVELGLKWKGTGDKRMAEAPPIGHESPLQVFGHHAEKAGNVEFIARKGTPLNVKEAELPANKAITMDAASVPRNITSRRISFVEFLKQLRDEVGIIKPELNRELREKYEHGIEIKVAEEVIAAIVEGTWAADERRVSVAM